MSLLSLYYCTTIKATVLVSNPLTERQLVLVVAHSMQQGNGATGIAHSLLQEIHLGAFSHFVRLLLSESLMLQCMKTETKHKFNEHVRRPCCQVHRMSTGVNRTTGSTCNELSFVLNQVTFIMAE